jgi:acyl-CoA dehydrogenase
MDRPFDYAALDEGRHVNYWAYDPVLQSEVARTYPEDAHERGRERLSSFGEAVGYTIADNSDVVDRHGPELHAYDAEGEVANEVEYHPAQFESERLVFEHGVLADSFRAPPGRDEPMPHTHSLAMLYLLTYADVGLTCPMAMTAGVALVLENFDDGSLDEFFDGVTARDYDESMQGAMFLTEKQGGSDVGATETVAEQADDDTWRLTGEKWFCSNIDAEAALALARRPDAPDGTDGLSLFLLPRTKRDGSMNDVRYRRLKDKLGTISVPTGEMELEGAEAYLVGDAEDGFRQMAEMLNLERLANAMGAVGLVGRALLEAKVHAANREAFGSTIDQYPLMRADLVDMAVDHEAGTAFTFEAAGQFDRREREGDEDAYRLMRLLVPIAKYRTGRLAVDTASYAMEVLGGNGYVADFVTERLLRDAQVLPIWEGTSNVLSLDVLRALDRDDAHEPLLAAIQTRLDAVEHPVLADDKEAVRDAFHDLGDALATLAVEDRDYAQLYAKRLADLIYDVFTAALLLAAAQDRLEAGDARKALVVRRFVDRHLRERDARGITSGDRLPDEQFDAIVRFAPVAPEDVAETVAADD